MNRKITTRTMFVNFGNISAQYLYAPTVTQNLYGSMDFVFYQYAEFVNNLLYEGGLNSEEGDQLNRVNYDDYESIINSLQNTNAINEVPRSNIGVFISSFIQSNQAGAFKKVVNRTKASVNNKEATIQKRKGKKTVKKCNDIHSFNLYEFTTHVILLLAVPGLASDSFKIDFDTGTNDLKVRGKLDEKFEFDETNLIEKQLNLIDFETQIKIPKGNVIDQKEIKASYKNGLLKIIISKISNAEKAKFKKEIIIKNIDGKGI